MNAYLYIHGPSRSTLNQYKAISAAGAKIINLSPTNKTKLLEFAWFFNCWGLSLPPLDDTDLIYRAISKITWPNSALWN